jgi:hypothetical protein
MHLMKHRTRRTRAEALRKIGEKKNDAQIALCLLHQWRRFSTGTDVTAPG